MKIFITGSTGFIGTQTIMRLAKTQHQLNCLVRSGSNTGELEKLKVSITKGDVTDKSSLARGMKGCDCVLDLAATYSFWLPDRKIYQDVNITGARNVMESVLESGVPKVVHVSSIVIYGKPADVPFNEKSKVGPVRFSEYAQTKYEGDCIAWEMYEKKKLPLVMIYPGGVLGPDDPKATGQYIQNLIKRKLPATIFDDVIFPWVHVRDVAEVIVRAAEKENNIGEKYIAAKCNMTFGEINKLISEISGVPLPKLRMPDPLAMLNARLLTALADLIKKPPLWGMAIDQIRMMKEGAAVDGSKAEKELGITYTPIRTAIEEAVKSFQS